MNTILRSIGLLLLFFVPVISSCDDSKDHPCDVDIDPVPTPICFIVMDDANNNLLDAQFEGNILDNGIEVIYKDLKYPLIQSEYNPNAEKMGLHTGAIGTDKTPGIMFWRFYVGRDSHEDNLVIKWGDGTSDDVVFNYYYTVIECEPVFHEKIYLNGNLQSENSLTVSIIK